MQDPAQPALGVGIRLGVIVGFATEGLSSRVSYSASFTDRILLPRIPHARKIHAKAREANKWRELDSDVGSVEDYANSNNCHSGRRAHESVANRRGRAECGRRNERATAAQEE
jgi:hypothetical protein